MSIGQAWREHARLAILRLLDGAPYLAANDSVLTDALAELGIGATRDQVRAEIQWLEDQGLVWSEAVHHLRIAHLTDPGSDVARGARAIPGVKRPSAR